MPSTVIRAFNYDVNSRRLIVEFLSGRRYAYFNVPPDVYADLSSARSRGSYFNQKVRDQFSFSRLEA